MTIQWRAILPVILGAAIWLIPVPAGLTSTAWTYFALCVAVIAALISEPIPGPVAGLLGITVAAALNLVAANPDDSIRWALSGFANGTVWLIFVAFMFGLGYQKTGLGPRIALNLVRLLGRRTIGLGYAIACADLVLAPFMPSNTARSGARYSPSSRAFRRFMDHYLVPRPMASVATSCGPPSRRKRSPAPCFSLVIRRTSLPYR